MAVLKENWIYYLLISNSKDPLILLYPQRCNLFSEVSYYIHPISNSCASLLELLMSSTYHMSLTCDVLTSIQLRDNLGHMAKSMTSLGSKNNLYSATTCRNDRLFGFLGCAAAIWMSCVLLLGKTILKRNYF